jgi:aspartate/methionine/tyrosine aminotransferase
MAARPGGFELLSVDGFFGWVRHPFRDRPAECVVREIVVKHGILVIPGTAFEPGDRGTLRVSISNIGRAALGDLAGRLTAAGVCGVSR